MKLKALIALSALTLATQVWAHSGLAFASPEPGSTIGAAPEVVSLDFTDDVALAGFSLIDKASGEEVEMSFTPTGKASSLHEVEIPVLESGSYQVKWKALGADGHTIEGNFDFTLAP